METAVIIIDRQSINVKLNLSVGLVALIDMYSVAGAE